MRRLRLTKEDQAKYGGDRWYDIDDLDKVGTGLLIQFEEATNIMAGELDDRLKRGSIGAVKALAWLALRAAGRADAWRDFDIDAINLEVETFDEDEEGEQTDPPSPNRADRRAAQKRTGGSAT